MIRLCRRRVPFLLALTTLGLALGSCGGGMPAAPTPEGVTGTWVGLVANGDGVTMRVAPGCAQEMFDLQLRLTQNGTDLTGTAILTVVAAPRDCDPVGRVDTSPLAGKVGSGMINFAISSSTRGRLVVAGTYTASRMTGNFGGFESVPGTFAANKQ